MDGHIQCLNMIGGFAIYKLLLEEYDAKKNIDWDSCYCVCSNNWENRLRFN